MRILLVNPNITKALTDKMADISRTVLPEEFEIVPLTANRGFPYIASRAEAQVCGAVAYEMIAGHADDTDAAIIAAFGDPGLAGARELFDFPVVGMAEAALMTAAMLGERFAIVTFSPVMTRWYVDSVRDAGLISRFTGVRTPPIHNGDFGAIRENLRDDLIELCKAAVSEDGADVVILGGAPLAGLAREIENDVAGIVVDPISAAVAQAVALLTNTSSAAFKRRHSKPIPKKSEGLSKALSRSFAQEAKK